MIATLKCSPYLGREKYWAHIGPGCGSGSCGPQFGFSLSEGASALGERQPKPRYRHEIRDKECPWLVFVYDEDWTQIGVYRDLREYQREHAALLHEMHRIEQAELEGLATDIQRLDLALGIVVTIVGLVNCYEPVGCESTGPGPAPSGEPTPWDRNLDPMGDGTVPGGNWGDPSTLDKHFADHGADFGAVDASDYSQKATDFLNSAESAGRPTKINDVDGVTRVYDPDTNTFGSYNANGTTKTFFKPDPAIHKEPTNMDYWNKQAGRVIR